MVGGAVEHARRNEAGSESGGITVGFNVAWSKEVGEDRRVGGLCCDGNGDAVVSEGFSVCCYGLHGGFCFGECEFGSHDYEV